MELWYNATHSITFVRTIDNQEVRKNTWTDWHAVPSSRPQVNPPEVKTKFINIPGAHGQIDMTGAVTGGIRYSNTEGDIELILRNSYPSDNLWYEVYNDILKFLHGQVVKIIFEDHSNLYWEGRTTVSSITSEKMYTKIKIAYTAYPFPIERDNSDDPPITPFID